MSSCYVLMHAPSPAEPGQTDQTRIDRLVEQRVTAQLDDLARLRAAGVDLAEELSAGKQGVAGRGGTLLAFTRVSRAIRQIIVLEQELMGLRAPPPRRAGVTIAKSLDAERDKPWPGGRPSAARPWPAALGSDLHDPR